MTAIADPVAGHRSIRAHALHADEGGHVQAWRVPRAWRRDPSGPRIPTAVAQVRRIGADTEGCMFGWATSRRRPVLHRPTVTGIMKFRSAIALTLALLAFVAAPARAQTLTVSTNNTPLDRQALQDIGKEALRRLNLNLELVTLPSARSLAAADAGEVDGEGLRVADLSAQFPNLVQVPEPFVRISFVAFSRDATIGLDGGWNALKPYRVAHINGWKMFEAHAGVARAVHKVDRPEQLFQMLQAGHVDLALYTRADGVALARRLGLADLAPLSPALRDVDLYLYLHRRHQALVPRLAATLRQMKVDGTYNRLVSAIRAD